MYCERRNRLAEEHIEQQFFALTPPKPQMNFNTSQFTLPGQSPTRAFYTGLYTAGLEILMNGTGGNAQLPLVRISVPEPVAMFVNGAIASYGGDIALSVLDQFGLGESMWLRILGGLGAAGAIFTYTSGARAGDYWEEFALGSASYFLGDKTNSYVYQSPGKIMPM